MATANQAIELAKSQVGVSEHPPGSNRTIFGEWFGIQTFWCSVFLSWVFFHIGMIAGADYPHTAAVLGVKAWGETNHRMVAEPEPGDVAIYYFTVWEWIRRRYNHVELVVKVHADGTFDSIGGNTNGKGSSNGGAVVYQTNRKRKYFATTLFMRPRYSDRPSPIPPSNDIEDDMPAVIWSYPDIGEWASTGGDPYPLSQPSDLANHKLIKGVQELNASPEQFALWTKAWNKRIDP